MVKYICDGCGKEKPALISKYGETYEPTKWFSRHDKDGPQHACSRPCIEKINIKPGKTPFILPF